MTEWPNPITHPDYYDPLLSPERNPPLPAGYNADDYNSDEVNGSGTNWPIWPMIFDSYEGFRPIIVTDEFLEVFEGCADYVVPCQSNTIVFPREVRSQKTGRY